MKRTYFKDAGFENGGMGPLAKECRLEAGKGKKTGSPIMSPKEMPALPTL